MPATVTPLVYAIPVQLIAYHTAVVMGTDVDQPRNLANRSRWSDRAGGCADMSPRRQTGNLSASRARMARRLWSH